MIPFLFLILAAATPTVSMEKIPQKIEVPVIQPYSEIMPPDGLFLDHALFDFGTVYQGSKTTHSFTLKNTGDTAVTITQIKTDCGCAAAVTDTDVIQPGAETAIRVTFDADRREGSIQRTVTVFVNLPVEKNWFELKIKANVTTLIKTFPGHVYFKDVYYGDGAEETIVIRRNGDLPVNVTGVNVLNGNLSASLTTVYDDPSTPPAPTGSNPAPENLKPVKEWQLTLTLPNDAPAGRVKAELQIITDSDIQPEYIVPVFGVVRSRLRLFPTQCYFGTLAAGESSEKKLTLTAHGDEPLKQPELVSDIPSLKTRVEVVSADSEYAMFVTLTIPEDYEGPLQGSVTIKTGDPVEPEIQVPVFSYTPHVAIVEP